ncbi:hypothetical protein C8R45DRAFT_929296 [Mycena sanguinolenta]|nr:hypothetical protein C8R45DRAFT_929296 [Mycena sanguinolenta]
MTKAKAAKIRLSRTRRSIQGRRRKRKRPEFWTLVGAFVGTRSGAAKEDSNETNAARENEARHGKPETRRTFSKAEITDVETHTRDLVLASLGKCSQLVVKRLTLICARGFAFVRIQGRPGGGECGGAADVREDVERASTEPSRMDGNTPAHCKACEMTSTVEYGDKLARVIGGTTGVLCWQHVPLVRGQRRLSVGTAYTRVQTDAKRTEPLSKRRCCTNAAQSGPNETKRTRDDVERAVL